MPQVDVQMPSEDENFDTVPESAETNEVQTDTTTTEPDHIEASDSEATGDDQPLDSNSDTTDAADPPEADQTEETAVPETPQEEPQPIHQPTPMSPPPTQRFISETLPFTRHQPRPSMQDVAVPDSSADKKSDVAELEPALSAPEQTIEPMPSEPSTPVAATPSDSVVADQDEVVAQKKRRNPLPLRFIAEIILLLGIIGLGLICWNLYSDKQDLTKQLASVNANPEALVQKQTQQLVATVGQLTTLPTGETPTIAAVTDVVAARKQSAFFDAAQNGDKVLLYTKAGEAILYRPSTNKVILVAPLTISGNTAATTSTSKTASTSSSATK